AWKLAFDKHAPARKAAGLSKAHVLRAVEDPNAVTVLLDFADAAKAKAFSASPDLKAAMKSAGVVGKPQIHVLNKAT
ncbi:MAG TPA: antibiotic biosynthesis monooxygenase, partial [Candidatus Bathyarchaeia archaeon]|nr:antibiotic biosynthesis monooxygenase [Candidatus Bathyarchaeia archaeon]